MTRRIFDYLRRIIKTVWVLSGFRTIGVCIPSDLARDVLFKRFNGSYRVFRPLPPEYVSQALSPLLMEDSLTPFVRRHPCEAIL